MVVTMLHYARLELRPMETGFVWARLRDSYDVHQALWSAFEGHAPGVPAPFLFRADRVRVGDEARLRVLVQSEQAPRWDRLGPVVAALEQSPEREEAWLRSRLERGAVLRFFLRANTTKSVRAPKPEPRVRGKRVALEREEDQRAWLVRRLDAAGARVCAREVIVRREDGTELERRSELELRTSNTRVWRWEGSHKNARGVHQGVDFEGLLEVTNTDALLHGLINGIGPAKGLGFGLLSVAPLQR